ncbi:ABC transporter ATP-binding protein [Butyrivibrio sp. NC3005]|uniref:ABC transporter ATP-binding protein n=1 Tax=Butyrivibrio sp. NC3005 TaxID=1280685 RepID=UPI00040C3969|nr:ABC transporter ATP-binding protein [Butyrivibrio sp. NC3005]
MEKIMLELWDLHKIYSVEKSGVKYEALKGVDFQAKEGDFIAIMGESGSGKTTTLNIIASLDTPTSGEVVIGGVDVSKMNNKEICKFRRENLGFVFQDFNLLNYFTVKDNIAFPLVLLNKSKKEIDEKVNELAEQTGITKLLDKYPYEISGGEKQRTAVARALVCDPQLVLADEPTGALDSKNSDQLMELFQTFNEKGQTIIMVTHSIKSASKAKKVLFLKDGMIGNTLDKADRNDDEFEEEIANFLYNSGK